MAGKISKTFFWVRPSADELFRQAMFNQMIEATLWAAQSALSSLLPLIPWVGMKDWMLAELSKIDPSISGEQPVVDLPSPPIDVLPEVQDYQLKTNSLYIEDLHWATRIPSRSNGDLLWNPKGNSLLDWWHNSGHIDGSLWKQDFYGEWRGK